MHGSNLTKRNGLYICGHRGDGFLKNLNFLLVMQKGVGIFLMILQLDLIASTFCSSSNCMEHFPFDLASLCYCTPLSSHLIFVCSMFIFVHNQLNLLIIAYSSSMKNDLRLIYNLFVV